MKGKQQDEAESLTQKLLSLGLSSEVVEDRLKIPQGNPGYIRPFLDLHKTSRVKFNDKDIDLIIKLIQSGIFSNICLECPRFEERDLVNIIEILKARENFKRFSIIADNSLNMETADEIAEMLKQNPTITHFGLSIQKLQLFASLFAVLIEPLNSTLNITSFSVSFPSLPPLVYAQNLGKMFGLNKTLITVALRVEKQAVTTEIFNTLAKGLAENPSITSLSLTMNMVPKCFLMLSKLLQKNYNIVELPGLLDSCPHNKLIKDSLIHNKKFLESRLKYLYKFTQHTMPAIKAGDLSQMDDLRKFIQECRGTVQEKLMSQHKVLPSNISQIKLYYYTNFLTVYGICKNDSDKRGCLLESLDTSIMLVIGRFIGGDINASLTALSTGQELTRAVPTSFAKVWYKIVNSGWWYSDYSTSTSSASSSSSSSSSSSLSMFNSSLSSSSRNSDVLGDTDNLDQDL